MNLKFFCVLLSLSGLSSANTDLLGQWTFNNSASVATALQSSGVAPGTLLSSLTINPSHDAVGINKVPDTGNGGYGFGGNSGEAVNPLFPLQAIS